MKKVLVWNNFPLKNIGGQAGYCYNIYEYLRTHPTPQITFLTDLIAKETNEKCEFEYTPIYRSFPDNSSPSLGKNFVRKIENWLPLYVGNSFLLRTIKQYKNNIKIVVDDFNTNFHRGLNDVPATVNLNEYDFIHFHWVQTLLQFKAAHPEYRGKTILTSHCPCPWTDERLTFHKPFAKYFRWLGIKSECEAYRTADYMMFPCVYAREPYEKDKNIQKTFFENNRKFFYVPTAILDTNISFASSQKISEFGIPQDAFVITFFGRHNEIKGYDILKNIGVRLLDRHQNLFFLCAGGGDIKPLNHPRWIELGFITNAVELHSQSDLYILPNRETYFDIGTLEVLRAGVHILMSDTGGNKYFREFPKDKTQAIGFFDLKNLADLEILVEIAIESKQMDEKKYKDEGLKNRALYLDYFTMDKYIPQYLKEIERLA